MITPKQQKLLDKLQKDPAWKTAFQKLDLQIIPSQEFKRNTAISNRVDSLIQEFDQKASNLTHKRRPPVKTYSDPSEDIWDRSAQIRANFEAIYGPNPTYPLPFDCF